MAAAAFFGDSPENLQMVYGCGRKEQLEARVDFFPGTVTSENFDRRAAGLGSLEYIFSTWGMPALSADQIACLPALKAVFYAAGTVQEFARPFLSRGVRVCSAWAANAVPVVEFTLAQISLAAKGYFTAVRRSRTPQGRLAYRQEYPGSFDIKVAILGAGMIGTQVLERLAAYQVEKLVFDPFLAPEKARALDARLVDLPTAFREGFIVSNHLANLPETVGLLSGDLFASLPLYATFINTGRGATVAEPALLAVLAARPDLTALLDVTWPEPPDPASPLYRLDNVIVSPHIAGSQGREVVRMADYMIAEFQRLLAGAPFRYSVTLEQLKTMA